MGTGEWKWKLYPSTQKSDSDFVKRVNGVLTDEAVKHLAHKTALSITDVKLWIDHLKQIQTRRKQGAKRLLSIVMFYHELKN